MTEVVGQPHSEKFLRKRKMLLFFPFLVIPMLCLVFYSQGGGKGTRKASLTASGKGLNMELPEARLDKKKKPLNKLGYYNQADQDSLRLLQNRKQDPYYNRDDLPVAGLPANSMALEGDSRTSLRDTDWHRRLPARAGENTTGIRPAASPGDRQAAELLQKLDLLKGVLKGQTGMRDTMLRQSYAGGLSPGRLAPGAPYPVTDLDKLTFPAVGNQYMLESPHDPDLDKLTGLVDKILRLKYPAEDHRLDTAGADHDGRPVHAMTGAPKEELVRILSADENKHNDTGVARKLVDGVLLPGPGRERDKEEQVPGTGFIELDEQGVGPEEENTFEAVVLRDQTVVSGQQIEFRLTQEALINGVRIPIGNLFSGKTALSGERLLVTISSIRVGKNTMPVALEVLDLDGIAGIRERGSMSRDVSKESAQEAINSVGTTSIDASLGAQAASAGLQTAKALLTRRVKLVRVGVTAGYKVLLRNTKESLKK